MWPVSESLSSPDAKSQICARLGTSMSPSAWPKADRTHLDDPVSRTRRKPLVSRFDRDSPDPSEVSRDDARELPWRVVVGLDLARFSSPDEGLREERRRGVGGGERGGGRGEGLGAARRAYTVSVRLSTRKREPCAPERLDSLYHRTWTRSGRRQAVSGSQRPQRRAHWNAPSIIILWEPVAACGPAGRAGPAAPSCWATRAAGSTLALRYSASILVAKRSFVLFVRDCQLHRRRDRGARTHLRSLASSAFEMEKACSAEKTAWARLALVLTRWSIGGSESVIAAGSDG